jgi:hypothetical protein
VVENRGPEARAVRGAMSKSEEGRGVDAATEWVGLFRRFSVWHSLYSYLYSPAKLLVQHVNVMTRR